MSLGRLLESRRVVLCVGCGGVGKTTTSAALGLAAAARGKRVLCLTIDPAHRLAQSLGLEGMKSEEQQIEPARFAAAGLDVAGSLTVMMLDTKRTFDDLVTRYASSAEARDRILGNKLYRYVSTSLAGTQEYMAMEKLHALEKDERFDLIVLDTPPTANALDFLDAPERMIGALDSAVMRWFVAAFETSGKLSLDLLARSTALVLRGIGKLTGGGFLEDVAQFVTELNDLFGGFKERAAEVASALRGPGVGYVLVTSPEPMSLREVGFFAERLVEQGMRADALVVNRVHSASPRQADEAAIHRAILEGGLSLDAGAEPRIARAAHDEALQARLDAANLAWLEGERPIAPVRVDVPAFARDVHDLAALAEVARILAGAPA